jgi:ferrochelatase
MEGKTDFLKAGGKEYHYIPALNDRPMWIKALTDLVQNHLTGWLEESWSQAAEQSNLEITLQKARGLGAQN